MNLPLEPTALASAKLIGGASRFAARIADRVGDAIGFDKVLRDGADEKPAENPQQILGQLVQAIRDRLGQLGVNPNQMLELSVTQQGRIRVDGNHRRAAEIESVLNGDPQLVSLASRLHRTIDSGNEAISFRIAEQNPGSVTDPSHLTTSPGTGNILQTGQGMINGSTPRSPGGYPNW